MTTNTDKPMEGVVDVFIEKHVSKWMVDDGNNKFLWKDKAPTPNQVLDIIQQAIVAKEEEILKLAILSKKESEARTIYTTIDTVDKAELQIAYKKGVQEMFNRLFNSLSNKKND